MTNGAIIILYSILSSPEWARDTKTIYSAGKLCIKLSDIVDKMPKEADNAKTWEREESGVPELEPCEFQVAVEAFKFFAAKGAIRPNRWTVELQELLKLTP